MAKTLNDIFNDDEFGLLDVKPKTSVVKSDEDRLIDSFHEINAFYEKNNREPSSTSLSEYGLLSRLKSLRENEKNKIICKPFDRFNLLGHVDIPKPTLEEILDDDDLGLLDLDEDLSIHTFKHTPKQEDRAKTEVFAQRKPIPEKEFVQYEKMFQEVHRDLKSGIRKLKEVKNVEQSIFKERFYLLDGILLFVEDIDYGRDEENLKETTKSRKDGRTTIIFENATKSNMLYRSLTKQLYKSGKLITLPNEKSEEELFKSSGLVSEEDVQSGWIYILKSKSKNPKIAELKDLYKIGFSKYKVEDRIKNASKEATFLFADVEIVDKYTCYNLNTHNFENLIHRFFGSCCLNIDIYNEKKQRITPREWFVVPLPVINEVISLIISGGIVNYKYDLENRKLVFK